MEAWLRAFNAKDIDTLLAIYDPEAVYANAAASLMTGTKQIAPWYEAALGATTSTLLFREEALFQSHDMALMVGQFYFRPTPDSKEEGETGRVALGLRRDSHDAWRLFFDMDNRPPDALKESFA